MTLTDYLTEDLPDVTLIMNQPRRFEISDGTSVHGWVLREPDTTGAGPLLLDIHGGPHNAWTGAADTAHLSSATKPAASTKRTGPSSRAIVLAATTPPAIYRRVAPR